MIPTNIYENECVDICEVLYHILNQVYKFDKVIAVREIKDIKKISNTNNSKTSIYIDISNYRGSARTVIKRLNTEAFININKTLVVVIPQALLKFVSCNCINISVEYVPQVLKLDDVEIEIEENLAIVTFNPKNIEGENNEY
ncbi:TPA: hypothetical protein ACG3HD_003668 [Clostridioides difficile]